MRTGGQFGMWHGHLGYESQGRPGPGVAGEDHGRDARVTHGRDAHATPLYDLAGNMISGPQPRYETADANTQWYKYDAWNRLARLGQGASSPGTTVATYSYDGLNRRIRKVVAATPSNITYDYYYNESWQVLEVRNGSDPEDPDGYKQYVWGVQYIDAPVVRFRDGNVDGDLLDTQNNVDSTLYDTYDGNFNVTAVIKPDGTVAERYTYDPYGKVTFKNADWSDATSQAKSAYDNEILYCGYRFDPESGNYIARNRYLTPPLGRWLTPDPIVYGDGMNLYQYVGGRPVTAYDSHGLYCCVDRVAFLYAASPGLLRLSTNPAGEVGLDPKKTFVTPWRSYQYIGIKAILKKGSTPTHCVMRQWARVTEFGLNVDGGIVHKEPEPTFRPDCPPGGEGLDWPLKLLAYDNTAVLWWDRPAIGFSTSGEWGTYFGRTVRVSGRYRLQALTMIYDKTSGRAEWRGAWSSFQRLRLYIKNNSTVVSSSYEGPEIRLYRAEGAPTSTRDLKSLHSIEHQRFHALEGNPATSPDDWYVVHQNDMEGRL